MTDPKALMERIPRWFLATVITWFFVGAAAAWAADSGDVLPAVESTVYIDTDGSHGSGFHVGGGLVVTAAHVVEGKDLLDVRLADDRVLRGRVVFWDSVNDVAVLRLTRRAPMALSAASVACRAPVHGEIVEARGNPYSDEFVSTWGRVSGRERGGVVGLRKVVPLDANILPGYSGGPVFAYDGRVIGIVAAVSLHQGGFLGGGGPAGIGWFVPSSTLCDVLTSIAAVY